MVLAILARGIVPVGYMPAGQGVFEVVICTAYGAATITVDENGQPAEKKHPQNHKDAHKALCAFGLNTAADVPNNNGSSVALPAVLPQQVSPAPATHPAMAVLRKTAPPRAPPSIS